MSVKKEIKLEPQKCISCDEANTCYFGKFFRNLKKENCMMRSFTIDCHTCDLYDNCLIKHFELEATITLPRTKDLFKICEN